MWPAREKSFFGDKQSRRIYYKLVTKTAAWGLRLWIKVERGVFILFIFQIFMKWYFQNLPSLGGCSLWAISCFNVLQRDNSFQDIKRLAPITVYLLSFNFLYT